MPDELEICMNDMRRIINDSHTYYYQLLSFSYSIPFFFNKGKESLPKDIQKLQSSLYGFEYFEKEAKCESKLIKVMSIDTTKEIIGPEQLEWIHSVGELFELVSYLPSKVNNIFDQLNSNSYFGVNFDTVLNEMKACSCMTELVSILGKILLLLDVLFPGDLRERILVMYYRLFLKPQNRLMGSSVIPILKSTGFVSNLSLPKRYPFDYFDRCNIQEQRMLDLIERINNCDLYKMMQYYSVDNNKNYLAYHYQANQAIVLSFFCPSLKGSGAEAKTNNLKSILEKSYDHFQWVELGPSLCFKLKTLYSYAGSCSFIEQLCSNESFSTIHEGYLRNIQENIERTDSFVKDKSLDFHLVLTNRDEIINLIRSNNYLIQWFSIHYLDSRLYSRSISKIPSFFDLLLKSAQLEALTKQAIQYIQHNKLEIWSYYHSQLTSFFESYINDEIRTILDDLLHFSEQPTRLTECYKNLRSLKEMLTTSFVGIHPSCHTVIGNMMRLTLLVKEEIEKEKELNVITECSIGSILTAYQSSFYGLILQKKEQAIGCIVPLLTKMEGVQTVIEYVEAEVFQEYFHTVVNRFMKQIPSTIAQIYSELRVRIEESQSKISSLPYEIKHELKLYSFSDERRVICNALSQISGIAKEVTSLDRMLHKKGYESIMKRTQKEFIQSCIHTLTTILQSSLTITQSTRTKASSQLSPLLIPVIETGNSLLLFKQTLQQLELILHFNSDQLYRNEYNRIIQFFLYEDITTLTKDKSKPNPFQNPLYPISTELMNTNKFSFIGSFIGNCLKSILDSYNWYSEASSGWVNVDNSILLNIDSFVLLLNNLGSEMIIAIDEFSRININVLMKSFYSQIQNQMYAVKYSSLRCDSSSFIHEVHTMLNQFYGEAMVNIKVVSRLGALVLIRCLVQKSLYLYNKKEHYEEITSFECKLKDIEDLLQSQIHQVDRDRVHSALQGVQLPHQMSIPQFAEKVRVFGLGRPLEEIYTTSDSFIELPYSLFIACIYASKESSFIEGSQTLYSMNPDRGHIDGIALAAGVASLLTQYDISYSQTFMELYRCYIRGEIGRDITKKEYDNLGQLSSARWLVLKIASLSTFIREGCESIIVDIANMKFGAF